jgi:glycosyltransferase involved in cell wall biosynthesis
MKIAQVCPRYHPYIGGIETHVREISERLVKRGIKVELLSGDPSGKSLKEEIINGVKVRRFRSWAPNEAYYFSRELKKYLLKNSVRFEIVHAHSYHAFPALYAAQAKNRNKLVFTPHYHGKGHTFFRNLLHKPYKFLGKSIFRKADKIICVSNYEKSLIVNHFKIDEEKVAVIPNGVNLEEFRDLERRRKDCRAILYVGRLEKYKGVHYLVNALQKLDNDVILEIVGKGPYKKSLVKLVRKLGLEYRVKFYQDLPRNVLLHKYANANIFVLLSKLEAFGISVSEALASKIPCILANTSALKEWVDNENCFGIDYPIDLGVLVDLIKKVAGKNVRRPAVLDWSEVTDRLVRLYTDAINA